VRLREEAAAEATPHAPVAIALAVDDRHERQRLGGLGGLVNT
jgi:hypothetical protein